MVCCFLLARVGAPTFPLWPRRPHCWSEAAIHVVVCLRFGLRVARAVSSLPLLLLQGVVLLIQLCCHGTGDGLNLYLEENPVVDTHQLCRLRPVVLLMWPIPLRICC